MSKVPGLGRSVGVLGLGACILGTALAVVACSSDATEASPTSPDGSIVSPTPTPEADGSTTPADAGSDEIVTEGGSLPPEDPNASADEDAGIDAGPSCAKVLFGAYSASTCNYRKSTPAGGALTTTTYTLKSVTVLRSATFCTDTFEAYEHRGGLKVTASSASAATLEFFDLYRPAGSLKASAKRYDVQVVANGAQLAFTSTACASKPAPATASYTVGTDNGKKTLLLRLEYGAGSADYRFVEP